MVDDKHPNLIYTASWDGTCREWDVGAIPFEKCTKVFEGAPSDLIGMSQCTTEWGARLLFASCSSSKAATATASAVSSGIYCWGKDTGALLAVFSNAGPSYAVLATPKALYGCMVTHGVVKWPLVQQDIAAARGPIKTLPEQLGKSYAASHLGSVYVKPEMACNGMALALSPAQSDSDSPQLLLSGHIKGVAYGYTGLSTAQSINRTFRDPLVSLAKAFGDGVLGSGVKAITPSKLESKDFYYPAFVWDTETNECVTLLAGLHSQAIRAVVWIDYESVLSGDLEGKLVQWAVPSGLPLRVYTSPQKNIRVLRLAPALPSPAGPGMTESSVVLVASGSSEGPAIVVHAIYASNAAWKLATGRTDAVQKKPSGDAIRTAKKFVAAGKAGDWAVVEPPQGVPVAVGVYTNNSLYGMDVLKGGAHIYSGHKGGAIAHWTYSGGRRVEMVHYGSHPAEKDPKAK